MKVNKLNSKEFPWYFSQKGIWKSIIRFIGHLYGVWTADEYLEIARKIPQSKGLYKQYLKIKYRKIGNLRGLGIENYNNLGKNFHLPHGINIIINEHAVVGNNCTVYQGVTIGVIYEGKKSGAPTIEDNVTIGPNAVVVGNVTIGHDSVIAGNSFVNIDIPPYSIVIGNPAVIHKKK